MSPAVHFLLTHPTLIFHLFYVAAMPGVSAMLHFKPVYIPLALHDWFGAAPETRKTAPAPNFQDSMCICNTAHAPASQIPWSGLRPDTPRTPHEREKYSRPFTVSRRAIPEEAAVMHSVIARCLSGLSPVLLPVLNVCAFPVFPVFELVLMGN